jgi:SAM-dependent MidA family methyltransferase
MWIAREIERVGGEVSFRDFMELALYHPENGYYTAGRPLWGFDGDYLTAPTASAWYARTVGRLIGELASGLGRPVELVDLAAGNGAFLATVLDDLGSKGAPTVLARVVAVERSPARRAEIRDRLGGPPVPLAVVEEIGRVAGPAVVHASELYDAMPVHRVEGSSAGPLELTVRSRGDELEWGRRPAGRVLLAYLAGHGVELAERQIAELNPAAEPFHRRVLEAAGEGVVLVLDYGYPADRLYDPRGRRRGSLATYRRHERGADPLADPGDRDLTAHVNLDDLRRAARNAGWREIALLPLAEFLVRSGLGRLVDEAGLGIEAEPDAAVYGARQEIKRLLDPEGMGSDLKMLVQARGELGERLEDILRR